MCLPLGKYEHLHNPTFFLRINTSLRRKVPPHLRIRTVYNKQAMHLSLSASGIRAKMGKSKGKRPHECITAEGNKSFLE